MPSLFPPYSYYQPVTITPDRFASPTTGALFTSAQWGFAGESSNYVVVGEAFDVPGDVVALTVFATVDMTYECHAWAALFGYAACSVSAAISLFNNQTGSSMILNTCETEVDGYRAWVGSYGDPSQVTETYNLQCNANWGQALGVPSTWTVAVTLRALTDAGGAAGAWASISTVVSRIDYELFWPGV